MTSEHREIREVREKTLLPDLPDSLWAMPCPAS